jgi:methylated-DNA-[protein]-cysteine S-methyltransferase
MRGRTIETPLGPITGVAENGAITYLLFGKTDAEDNRIYILDLFQKEIEEYFSGIRREFTIHINPKGTEYQKKVWSAAMEIPYGETRSYEWIAKKAGGSPRSVGNALGANPIPIIIPCHRVIRKDGSLGGYSSGIERKRFFLELEGYRI